LSARKIATASRQTRSSTTSNSRDSLSCTATRPNAARTSNCVRCEPLRRCWSTHDSTTPACPKPGTPEMTTSPHEVCTASSGHHQATHLPTSPHTQSRTRTCPRRTALRQSFHASASTRATRTTASCAAVLAINPASWCDHLRSGPLIKLRASQLRGRSETLLRIRRANEHQRCSGSSPCAGSRFTCPGARLGTALDD
jgi:hypothetical protein